MPVQFWSRAPGQFACSESNNKACPDIWPASWRNPVRIPERGPPDRCNRPTTTAVSGQARARDREWDALKKRLRLSHSAEDTRFTGQRTKHAGIVQWLGPLPSKQEMPVQSRLPAPKLFKCWPRSSHHLKSCQQNARGFEQRAKRSAGGTDCAAA